MTPSENLPGATWRKSSYSSGSGGACVEVAANLPGVVAIRDSKHPAGGAHLVERSAFRALLRGVKSGRFDT